MSLHLLSFLNLSGCLLSQSVPKIAGRVSESVKEAAYNGLTV
jgi:hypothetical protein